MVKKKNNILRCTVRSLTSTLVSVHPTPYKSSKTPSFLVLPEFLSFLLACLLACLLAVLCLHFCARAFSSCGKRGPLFIAVRGPLTIAASLVAEHRLQTHRLSSCGSLLCGMWDLPGPGLEPVSPALAGRFSTTAPPGKPQSLFKYKSNIHSYLSPFLHRRY